MIMQATKSHLRAFSKVVVAFYITPRACGSSRSSTPWSTLCMVCLFNSRHSNRRIVISSSGFDLHFPSDWWSWASFRGHLCHPSLHLSWQAPLCTSNPWQLRILAPHLARLFTHLAKTRLRIGRKYFTCNALHSKSFICHLLAFLFWRMLTFSNVLVKTRVVLVCAY